MNKDNTTLNAWLQQINAFAQQKAAIEPEQRLDIMLLLRSPFGQEGWQTPSELPLKDYPIALIKQFIVIAKRINDWPMITACYQAHQAHQELAELLCQQYQHFLQLQSSALPSLCCDELFLAPMDINHMSDFFWQYSEDIAYYCKLPEFDGEDKALEWQDWLQDHEQQPTASLFAIHHIDWGFVGSVCFDIYAGRGFFYYWIGENFRQLGLGPQAVQLVLNWATEHLNMHCCYAVIFESNTPSQKALQKLDFYPVALKVDDGELENQSQYEQELVFYRGAAKSTADMLADFNQLFVDIGSQLKIKHSSHLD